MYRLFFFSLMMLITTNSFGQERTRICPLDDYKCMRNYFAEHSTCERDVYGNVLDTFKIMYTRSEIMSLDTSFIDLYAEVINLDSCKVVEFDLIKKPEVVLLTLDCKDVTMSFNRTALRHRDHKLDQMFRYSITITYPLMRLVTYFGYSDGFVSACEAFTFAEIMKTTSFTAKAHDAKSKEFIAKDIIFKKASRRFVDIETISPAWSATLTNIWLNLKICNFRCFIANQYAPAGLSVRFGVSESAAAAKFTYY